MIFDPGDLTLQKGSVIQGGRERRGGDGLPKVAQIWHCNGSVWSTSSVPQPFEWGRKGAAPATGFPGLSSVNLAVSPCTLSKHRWLPFAIIPGPFVFARAPRVIFPKAMSPAG